MMYQPQTSCVSRCRVEFPALPFPLADDKNALAFAWMQTLCKRQPVLHKIAPACTLAATACAALLAGCASPGSPLPPSLKLPVPLTTLTAVREGEQVVLHWTTPARTTDRLLIAGSVTAAVCREPVAAAALASTPPPPARAPRAGTLPCTVVLRIPVNPGPSQAADPLPAALTSAAPGALAYRVWLLNSAGRTAGPSVVAYAASGPAPAPITGLRATSTRSGVVLEWDHNSQSAAAQRFPAMQHNGELVELDRTPQSVPGAPPPARQSPDRSNDPLSAAANSQGESLFRARDTGGAIDRTAQPGESYRYTVQRIRQVTLGATTLELRGQASPPLEVTANSVFPPETPSGLIAAPAAAPDGKPAVDLSWEPNVDQHLAGYKVYRRQAGNSDWQLLTAAPIRAAAYTDTTVAPGQPYSYRVSAIGDTGLESPPSAEAAETVPTR